MSFARSLFLQVLLFPVHVFVAHYARNSIFTSLITKLFDHPLFKFRGDPKGLLLFLFSMTHLVLAFLNTPAIMSTKSHGKRAPSSLTNATNMLYRNTSTLFILFISSCILKHLSLYMRNLLVISSTCSFFVSLLIYFNLLTLASVFQLFFASSILFFSLFLFFSTFNFNPSDLVQAYAHTFAIVRSFLIQILSG